MKFNFSTIANAKEKNNYGRMKSWQVHSYGGLEELQLTNSRIPVIRNPNDVIVQVSAASVNPIDVAMMCVYDISFLFFKENIFIITLKLTNFNFKIYFF